MSATLTPVITEKQQQIKEAARQRAMDEMRRGAYVFGETSKVMLLVPNGVGPADASVVARERLGHDGHLDVVAFHSAGNGKGVYVTYQAIADVADAA